jgi:hypothetical protein
MFAACMPGQVHSGPVAAPGPAYPAPAYPTPVVVTTPNRGYAGDCCGHASVCGDCGGQAKKCCLLDKIKSKLSCFKIDLCGKCDKGCDTGSQKSCNLCGNGGHKHINLCDKGKGLNLCNKAPACPQPCPPQPVCNPCPKPAPVCCKTEPVCHDACAKPCWTPGYFLHKCKEKLCGICDKKDACHGGCGTAATPNGCGSTVIPPATGPVTPVPVAPVQPELKKMPAKVGSAYPLVNPTNVTPAVSAPRTIDLNSIPF